MPLASAWYPPNTGHRVGLAGAGNSGTVLAALFAPAWPALGWQNVVGLAAIPLSATLIVFTLLAKDGPTTAAPKLDRLYRSAAHR